MREYTEYPRRGLYRGNGWIFGVCAGIADYFGLSAGGLRLVLVVLSIVTSMALPLWILAYIVMALIMKSPPRR